MTVKVASGHAVPGGQHHLARLQAHALAAFQAHQDAFDLLATSGNDFEKLFEQSLEHGEALTSSDHSEFLM